MVGIAEVLDTHVEIQAPLERDGHYLLSRYADVLVALKDPRFSSEARKMSGQRDWSTAWWLPSIFRALLNSMVMIDDPDHARLKNIVHQAFTPRVSQSMEATIERMSNELLDKMAQKSQPDLIQDFALPLPVNVISEVMGIPQENRPEFARLANKLLRILTVSSFQDMLRLLPSAMSLNSFFRKLIKLREKDPQDDLVTALVQAKSEGEKLSQDELVAMFFLLLLAGHETTVNLIGNGMFTLLEHPAEFAKLKANMGLLDSAIEEMLRFAPPVQLVAPRYTLEDVEVNGYLIPKNSAVIAMIGAANRDESVFANANEFLIERSPNKHLAFGLGIHYCLGAPLARIEGKIAFRNLLERYPNLQFAGEAVWNNNPGLTGLIQFPIKLN